VKRPWFNDDLQSFTPTRFMPPELMAYQGRAVVIDPLGGTVLAFRRSDKFRHGYKSFDGERRMIQMSWVKHSRFAWYVQQAARWWTHALKRGARVFS